MRQLSLWMTLCLTSCAGRGAHTDAEILVDSDDDGILDVHEGEADPDGDGLPAWRDPDSDGDGIDDSHEAGDVDTYTVPVDSDGDQTPDFLDLDSDGNGIPDEDEGTDGFDLVDHDGDGVLDSSDRDDDNDGVPDTEEMAPGRDVDSDLDTRVDRLDLDSDGDGLRDAEEGQCDAPRPCDTDRDGTPDRLDLDSDDDGLSDRVESGRARGLAEPAPDTDGDGTYDARDLDSDGDGLSDAEEITGLGDPLAWDTDGDGLSDFVELELGLDPHAAASTWDGPMYRVPARTEVEVGLSAKIGLEKLDIVIIMSSLKVAHLSLPHLFRAWDSLEPVARSVAISVVDVGSFGRAPWGCSEREEDCGLPQDLVLPHRAAYVAVPMTTDLRRAEVWATRELDIIEAAYTGTGVVNLPEALVQIATGVGYDVDCDGAFNERVDQPAWPSVPGDLFDGTSRPAWDIDAFTPAGDEGGVGFRRGSARLIYPMQYNFPSRCIQYHQPGVSPPSDVPTSHAHYFSGPEVCRPHSTWEKAADALVEARVWTTYRTRVGEPDSAESCGPMSDLYGYEMLPGLGWATDSVGDTDRDGELAPYTIDAVPFVDGLTHQANLERSHREEARPLFTDIARRLDPEHVSTAVLSDPHGFITAVTPSEVHDPSVGDIIPLRLDLRGVVAPKEGDRGYLVDIALIGDEHWHVYEETVLVIVPGWTRM